MDNAGAEPGGISRAEAAGSQAAGAIALQEHVGIAHQPFQRRAAIPATQVQLR